MQWIIVLLCASLVPQACLSATTQPEQVHLSLTGKPSEMCISWVTWDETESSSVLYGIIPSKLNRRTNGTLDHYYLPFYESPALHSATLTGLAPATRYFYKVGDEFGGWSNIFHFDTEDLAPVTTSNPLRIAIIADEGSAPNSQMVFDALTKADNRLHFDFLVLSGDLSYANGIQKYWDIWGRMIEPLASHFPWMFSPGNHEAISLFIPYNYRFTMPQNGDDNLYHSFNYRNVHVLVLNSESLNEFHWSKMYQWAAADLEAVDRSVTPWVFAAFHHPWYCSNSKHTDSAWFMKDEYEDLFHQYDVDIVLQGHVHAYERTHPVYKWNVTPGTTIYTTNGHAGNSEGLYMDWDEPAPAWSAYRESVYGFSTIEIFNATHLHWQMLRGNDSVVRDDYWLIKNVHL